MIKWILLVMSFSMISKAQVVPQFSYEMGDIVNEQGVVVIKSVILISSLADDYLEQLEAVDCSLNLLGENQKLFLVIDDWKIPVDVLITDTKASLFCESKTAGNIRKASSLSKDHDVLSEAEFKAILNHELSKYEEIEIPTPEFLIYEDNVILEPLEEYDFNDIYE